MIAVGGSAGLASLALLARVLTRSHGLEEGALRTARWVRLVYTQLKRGWVRQVCATLPATVLGRPTEELLNAYVRQEARRHAHQLLAGSVPGQDLAARFVAIDGATLASLPAGGAILLGAHFGFIPLAAQALSGRGPRTRLVMERAVCESFSRSWLGRCSPRFRRYLADEAQVIQTGGAFSKIQAALGQGERVCILGDVGHRYAVETQLLGRPARLASGPYRLARSAGVPLIPYMLRPEGPVGYRLSFGTPLDPEQPETQGVAAFAAGLEHTLQDCPEAWSILPWYLPSS